MTQKISGWKKAPPDGTNYSYWTKGGESCRGGAFLIETKERFRSYGYELFLPHSMALIKGSPIHFETLGAAKEATLLTESTLRNMQRCQIRRRLATFASMVGGSIEGRLRELAAEHGMSYEALVIDESEASVTV
jgi:hypothetical protein